MVAREPVTPVPVTGRRYRRKERYTAASVRRFLILGGVGVACILGYTVPFAGAAKEGYTQNKLKLDLQKIERENEMLRSHVARLKNPGSVAWHATRQGMAMRKSARFVTVATPRKADKPRRSLLARLTFFGLR